MEGVAIVDLCLKSGSKTRDFHNEIQSNIALF